MMNKQNVPELRFPEFSGEWKEQKLEEVILSIKTGTSELGSEQNSDHPLIKMGNLKLGGFKFDKLEYLSEEQASKAFEYRVNKGDFLFNTRNTLELVGKAATWLYESSNYLFNSNIARIEFDKYYLDTKFLNYYYSTNVVWRQIKARAVGTTSVAAVYPRDLYNVKVKLPSIQEQLKISKFFIKIDRLINLEEKKLELLEEQKKGYMQKIFSQELRFKDEDGNDYPEWEEKALGELGTFKSGTGFPNKEQGGAGEIPFYKISDMNKDENKVFMNTANNYVSEEQISKKRWKVINDVPAIVFAKVGAAIMLNRKRLVTSPFLIDNNIMSYSMGQEWFSYFGYLYFQTLNLPKYAQVGALPSYNSRDIASIILQFPTIYEQEKIGVFFKEIDKFIELTDRKLLLLQTRKNALLKNMFL